MSQLPRLPLPGPRALRAVLSLLAGLVLGAGLVAHGVWVKLHHSLPIVAGTLALPGLDAPADVLRDAQGVPHIFAGSLHDALFAEGFVHAQDRLWQMEFNRRIGRGRVAELVGARALPLDRLMRALDMAGAAKRTYAGLPQRTKDALVAYADGVNAFLATNKRPLPPEFFLLGVTPAPWLPEDSVLMTKLLAFQLAGNAFGEIKHLKLLARLGPDGLAAFEGTEPTLPTPQALYGMALHAALSPPAERLPFGEKDLGASNNWVVDGSWTKSGKPLLANDTHLGLTMPGVFYLVHLDVMSRPLIGASAPGVPGILLGRSDRLAWGYTNAGADVQDLFLERVDPADAGRTVTPDGAAVFVTRAETIKVRFGADVQEAFRATRHGPVIPADVLQAADLVPGGTVLALRWAALDADDSTLTAGLDMLSAQSGADFRAAMRGYVAPMQNMVYADVDGDFGLVVPGHVPLRAPENTTHGLVPAPGWRALFDWQGTVPFDALPHRTRPPGGLVVTANNDISPPGTTPPLAYDFDDGARARRIESLLAARHDHDIETFRILQQDSVSPWARRLFPDMRDAMADARPKHRLAGAALEALGAWDGDMRGERPAPLIFMAWIRETMAGLYGDETGPLLDGSWNARFAFLDRVLHNETGAAKWCDDVRTKDVETCGAILAPALDRALATLARDYGDHVATWRFEDAHPAVFVERPLGLFPVLGALFNRAVPSPGGADTIDRGQTDFASPQPFANVHAATYRGIYDLATPEASLFMIPTGESGNPLSPHYADLMAPWVRGDDLRMTTHRPTLEAEGASLLTLVPVPR